MTNVLQGKRALISGASSGIGAATALAMAAAGAQVTVAARRTDRLQALADQIATGGGKAHVVTADITAEAQAQQLVHEAHQLMGGIDILVNSAGVSFFGSVAAAQIAEWQYMLQINLLSLMVVTQATLPAALSPDRAGGVSLHLDPVNRE